MSARITHELAVDSISGVGTLTRIVECGDRRARFVRFAYRLDVTSADLVGTLTMYGGGTGVISDMYVLTTATRMTPAVAGAADASGVVTFSTVAAGVAHGLFSVADPPPYVALVHTYTSGGGTNRLRGRIIY